MRFRHLLAAIALLGAVASCGDDDDASVAADETLPESAVMEEGAATISLRFASETGVEDRQATAALVKTRLHEAGVAGASVEISDDGLFVQVPASSANDIDSIAILLTEPGTLEFRPVLSSVPADVASCSSDDVAVSGGGLVPQFDGPGDEPTLCHDLGPAEATGAIIADATAQQGGAGTWQIAIQLRPGPNGVDIFNAVAGSCFDRDPSCPSGQLAIVLDGVVMSAPTIQQPSFDDRGVSLTGQFAQAEAGRLAVILRSGALPVGLTVDEEVEG